ncbi:ead/Ea22-like family protein [Enterobacter ludwigii]
MSNIDKQALRKAAEKAGADEWRAFIDTKSKTYAVHTPGDNRCGDVVKWAGFDGQQKAANKARYIAAANPANVLALLDELEAAEQESENWRTSFDNERFRADKLAAEMEARGKQIANDVQIKARLCRESNSLHDRLREAEKRIAEVF